MVTSWRSDTGLWRKRSGGGCEIRMWRALMRGRPQGGCVSEGGRAFARLGSGGHRIWARGVPVTCTGLGV